MVPEDSGEFQARIMAVGAPGTWPATGHVTLSPYQRELMLLSTWQADFLRAIAELNVIQTQTLNNIANRMRARGKQLYITIPDGGGLYAIGQGATELNFFDGQIITTTGDVHTMRSNLKVQECEAMLSFMMSSSGAVDVSIDGGGSWSLDAGERLCIGDFAFKRIYLSAAAPTYIKLMAATTPDMTSFYDRFFEADLQSNLGLLVEAKRDVDERVQQIATLDLGTMTRVFMEAFGKASAATDFYLEASNDNVHWYSIDLEQSTVTYHNGWLNAARYVRLTSAAAGVAGDLVSLEITAAR